METNLIRLPVFCLSAQRKIKTIHHYGRHGDSRGRRPYEWFIRQSEEGANIPGPVGRRLWTALMSGDVSEKVTWVWRVLFSLAGMPVDGQSLKAAKRELTALSGIRITSKAALVSYNGSILPDINDSPLIHNLDLDQPSFTLPEWLIDNIENQYVTHLDKALWLHLHSCPLASRLYELLSQKLYQSDQWECPYQYLCKMLPTIPLKNIQEHLSDALRMLQGNGVIESIPKSNDNIVFVARTSPRPAAQTSTPKPVAAAPSTSKRKAKRKPDEATKADQVGKAQRRRDSQISACNAPSPNDT